MDGFCLFEWCAILEALIAPYPRLQIVLATSWVRVVGFDEALARLPDALQSHVVGATWQHQQSLGGWASLTRFEQIKRDLARHQHRRWLAIDDDGAGWPVEYLQNLVLTDSLLGLGAAWAQEDLREKLER